MHLESWRKLTFSSFLFVVATSPCTKNTAGSIAVIHSTWTPPKPVRDRSGTPQKRTLPARCHRDLLRLPQDELLHPRPCHCLLPCLNEPPPRRLRLPSVAPTLLSHPTVPVVPTLYLWGSTIPPTTRTGCSNVTSNRPSGQPFRGNMLGPPSSRTSRYLLCAEIHPWPLRGTLLRPSVDCNNTSET